MPKDNIHELVNTRFETFIHQEINSITYLIMTLIGDSVMPYGGNIWLGSIVQLLEPLAVSERLVRTSIFRLKKEGWLESTKIGRKSYYFAKNVEEINKNERILYYQNHQWDGNWRLVVGGSMEKSNDSREDFKKDLLKNNFMAVAPNVFAHPTFATEQINHLLEKYQQQQSYVVLCARDTEGLPLKFNEVEQVLYRGLGDTLKSRYEQFLAQYEAIWRAKEQISFLSDAQCFLLKTLMIDDYRRLQWRDAIRSTLLMNKDWVGTRARQLTADLYCLTDEKGQRHFREYGRCKNGALPEFNSEYSLRFKHLL